jgi:hypothetical protein
MPLEATVQGAPARLGMISLRQPSTSSTGNSVVWRNATTMASSAGVSTVLFRSLRPHRRISRHGPLVPLPHSLGIQVVARCKGEGALFRRLELGSNTRRRAGAAVQNARHWTSSS